MLIKRVFRKINIILYNILANHLPSSVRSNISRKIRFFFGKRILKLEGFCGKNVNFGKNIFFSKYLTIGDNSSIGDNSIVSYGTKIGKNVMMGPDCKIYTQNHIYADKSVPMINQGFSEVREVIINDDVWIGANVIILPGVIIGEGSVIGAGSVVTHDIKPYTVNAGNPCKYIKDR